ncbi:hypothetical protein A2U01_0063502, partial [Trifolium medium]|nr:hypothetical protein [Trifolium medium]
MRFNPEKCTFGELKLIPTNAKPPSSCLRPTTKNPSKKNAHPIILHRSKICSTRTSLFQIPKERGCVRMDRGVRTDPSALKKALSEPSVLSRPNDEE